MKLIFQHVTMSKLRDSKSFCGLFWEYQCAVTTTITSCPAGRVCTADRQICRLPDEGFTPICYEENCNNCEESYGAFTCLDQTTYGYCFGGSNTPYVTAINSCPQGYVCNTYSNDVCVPAETNSPSCLMVSTTNSPEESTTETTISTTESTSTHTTTSTELSTTTSITPSPPSSSSTTSPLDANTYCSQLGKAGYFKTSDPTCREYVYCYLLSGQYLGWYYYCNGYFNEVSGKCQAERPSDCQEQ
ncbi:uncharacterized protein [Musca autumnalis]|uniref:uncharacterized protein n=1 Tax=Musca autumnalis TaxID=221902 RepID=UPI003CF13628